MGNPPETAWILPCHTCEDTAARVLEAPKDCDYGLRDFDVADLDGNMIFFGMESQKAS